LSDGSTGPDASLPELPPEAWRPAHRAARRIASPIYRVLAIEAASGLLLLAATVIALIWANSPWRGGYDDLWRTELGVRLGAWDFTRSLQFWVDDVLMTVFFFVVGLEIRREMHEGELRDWRRGALPLAAALGGMLVPAAIYAALNSGHAGAAGWGIPMATDIAFAVGVLTVLGRRVAPAQRVLLLALAVIDDIGAIAVIAVFYSAGLEPQWLGVSAAAAAAVVLLRMAGLRSPLAYLVPAIGVWAGLYNAGIHPTLAGVALGMLTPVKTWFGVEGFAMRVSEHAAAVPGSADAHEVAGHLAAIDRARREAVSPARYLQELLHPWVAFVVMPVFALANAGVDLRGAELTGDGGLVFAGIVLGLIVGKPLGVWAASRVSCATGLATRPSTITYRGLAVVGTVAGIGFTMSLFIAQLAFPPGPLLATAKVAILAGSGAAMLLGMVVGVVALRRPAPDQAPAVAGAA